MLVLVLYVCYPSFFLLETVYEKKIKGSSFDEFEQIALIMSSYHLSDFQIVRKLGQGGFGSAFLVERKADGQKLCLKQLELPEDGSFVQNYSFR